MKWEYKKTGNLGQSSLDKLGEDGWELVAVFGNSYGGISTMIFKRQIKED